MLRIAGALADGTGLTITGPRYLEETVVPTLSRAADAASRGPLRIALAAPISVTRHIEAAKSAVRRMVPVENLPSYRRLLDADGLRDAADISIIDDERTVRAGVSRLAGRRVTDLVALRVSFDEDPEAAGRTRQLLTEFR
jgi:hypothetical protein